MMNINNITFIDVESVPQYKEFRDMPVEMQELFCKKFEREIREANEQLIDANEVIYKHKAALYAEFGKIVSISMGRMHNDKFKVKTITGRDEKVLLEQFVASLMKVDTRILCGYNSKEFDLPYIFRRMVVNSIAVPECLDVAGKKPWEVPHLDTMEMWSHLQFKYRCSLNVLAHILGIPSPKSEMSGDKVGAVYYGETEIASDELEFSKEEAALRMIGKYNAGDVVVTAQVYCRMKGLPLIPIESIEYL